MAKFLGKPWDLAEAVECLRFWADHTELPPLDTAQGAVVDATIACLDEGELEMAVILRLIDRLREERAHGLVLDFLLEDPAVLGVLTRTDNPERN